MTCLTTLSASHTIAYSVRGRLNGELDGGRWLWPTIRTIFGGEFIVEHIHYMNIGTPDSFSHVIFV